MRLSLLSLALATMITSGTSWAEDAPIDSTDPVVIEVVSVTTVTDENGEVTVSGGNIPIIGGIAENGGVHVELVTDGVVVDGSSGNNDETAKKATELLNMDFQSAEGKAKLQSLAEKALRDQMPRIQEHMAKQKLKNDAKLSGELGTTAEEFAAIQPLIDRVNNLLSQYQMVDFNKKQHGSKNNNNGMHDILSLAQGLSNSATGEIEPSIAELQKAANKLHTLSSDSQANATELEAAMTSKRKAESDFQSVLKNARQELRSVLNSRQEAVLVVRGTLD